MNYTIEESDPWYVRHGHIVYGLMSAIVLCSIFAWGMIQ